MTQLKQIFIANQAQTSNFPLMLQVERAEGNYIYDTEGKKYLDLISGISVSALGHGNNNVKNAIIRQLDKHAHVMVYGEYIQNTQAQLCKKITDLLPISLNSVYLLNSGAEATETALKLAKRVTGKPNIVANKNAYHGSTHAALSLNSNEYFKSPFRPLLPGVVFIDFNDVNAIEKINHATACVITEVIAGEAGYKPAKKEFLKALRQKCNDTCTLLIFDEIQSAMGKTGKMFAFEHYDVIPDILLLGKALGAGMPIGAVVADRKLMQTFAENPILGHITTFGGHPVIAAAAIAGIDEILNNNLISNVEQKEQLFRNKLNHEAIKSITGMGLMLALELDNFDNLQKVISLCLQNGLITDWFLFANNKLRIAPPLTINNNEILFACKVIQDALNVVYA
ncbi:MAG: aspartate aminotransferase family protein [Bacteroidia bacterium]